MQKVDEEMLKKVMSFIGSIKTEKKAKASQVNGLKNLGHHLHVFKDGKKCMICKKYKSQFRDGMPNRAYNALSKKKKSKQI